jgi:SAM-dependent methyltransferase
MEELAGALRRPGPFEGGAPFWDDPRIAPKLLAAHLDPDGDAASRRPAAVARTVRRLLEEGLAYPGARVLDLGCGPGLYALPLAAAGCRVTGVDLSERSLAHARAAAAGAGLAVEYRRQDFLTLDEPEAYDLVLQVYGELSTFGDEVRDRLLGRIRTSLAPGGAFVFDVSTPAVHPDEPTTVEVLDGGLFRDGRHVLISDQLRYEGDVSCRRYLVVDDEVTVYRMWFHDYTPATLTPVLEAAGFDVAWTAASLETGAPWRDGDPWLAVAARPHGPGQ